MEQDLPMNQQENQGIAVQTEGETDAAPYKVYASKEEFQQDFDAKLGKRLQKMRAMELQMQQVLDHFGADSIESVLNEPSSYLVGQVADALQDTHAYLCSYFNDVPDVHTLAKNYEFVQLLARGCEAVESFLMSFKQDDLKAYLKNQKDAAHHPYPVEGAASDSLTYDIFGDVEHLSDSDIAALAKRSRSGERISLQ